MARSLIGAVEAAPDAAGLADATGLDALGFAALDASAGLAAATLAAGPEREGLGLAAASPQAPSSGDKAAQQDAAHGTGCFICSPHLEECAPWP